MECVMEFFFLNVLLPVVITAVLAKLVFMLFDRDAETNREAAVPEESEREGVVVEERGWEKRGLVSEKKVKFVGEVVKVDEFEGRLETLHEGEEEFASQASQSVPVDEQRQVIETESVEQIDQQIIESQYGARRRDLGDVSTSGVEEEKVEESRIEENSVQGLVVGMEEETMGEDEVDSARIQEELLGEETKEEHEIKERSLLVEANEQNRITSFGNTLTVGVEEETKDEEEEEINTAEIGEESVKISAIGVEEEAKEEESIEKQTDKTEEEEMKSDLLEVKEELKSGVLEENVNEKMLDKEEIGEIAMEFRKQGEIIGKDEDGLVIQHENKSDQQVGVDREEREEQFEQGGLLSDDDDWEGIERSEVENRFGAAAKFVASGDNTELLSKLGSDVQTQLYGLHKVATEGPCREQAPLALMVSSRAKWNSWQRLGNMSPEVAMEQYVDLLSDVIPGWAGENSNGDHKEDKGSDSSEAGESGMTAHECSFLQHQSNFENESKQEDAHPLGQGSDAIGGSEFR